MISTRTRAGAGAARARRGAIRGAGPRRRRPGRSGRAAPAAAAVSCPWVGSGAPIPQRVSQLLAAMTVAQKVTVLTGASGSSYVGFTPAIGPLCIPAMNLEDGLAGVGDGRGSVTQLPAPVDVAATWDTAAERLYGQVIGAEQAAKGSSVDLGPTINIVRDPRWGRAFESIREDPYLNGALGAADIQGVQSTGVMAQVKHFAVYNQETNRNTPSDNAVVSTRAEQEIYLPAFAGSTQQGATSSVMWEGMTGTAVSVPVPAADSAGGQSLTFTASGLPAGTSISGSSGTITGSPSTAGTSTVTVTAHDATGASASASFTWTLTPAGLGRGHHPAGRLPGPVPGPDRRQQRQRHQSRDLHLQRHRRPAVDRGTRRDHPRGRQVPGRDRGRAGNGSLVDLYTCNGTGAQAWQPQSGGALVNPQSGKCLDDTGWSTTPGTQVQIWSCTGNANQSWVQP